MEVRFRSPQDLFGRLNRGSLHRTEFCRQGLGQRGIPVEECAVLCSGRSVDHPTLAYIRARATLDAFRSMSVFPGAFAGVELKSVFASAMAAMTSVPIPEILRGGSSRSKSPFPFSFPRKRRTSDCRLSRSSARRPSSTASRFVFRPVAGSVWRIKRSSITMSVRTDVDSAPQAGLRRASDSKGAVSQPYGACRII